MSQGHATIGGMDPEQEFTQEDIDALAELEERARDRAEAENLRRSEAMTAAMKFSSLRRS